MLDYAILKNKTTITKDSDYDGNATVEYYDLLSPSYNRNSIEFGTGIIVEEPYVARPDLISLAMYGTDQYADLICKVNGISNPFEINKGNRLIIPFPGLISKYYEATYNSNIEGTVSQESDDTSIKEDVNSYKKKKNEKRLPNELVTGETNYVIDRTLGVVFY